MQVCSLENGRAAANMLSGLKTAFEYSQVPPIQIRPVICALLGLLYIRYIHALLGPLIRASHSLGCLLSSALHYRQADNRQGGAKMGTWLAAQNRS